MAHLSMKDDAPTPHVPRPFLITLCYNGQQQSLVRPETLSSVRNNVTWTFLNLPIDTPPDTIVLTYRDGRQSMSVTNEDDWTALRSHRKIKMFTIEIIPQNSSPAIHFTEDSGFQAFSSSPSTFNEINAQSTICPGDTWDNDDATGDIWGDVADSSSLQAGTTSRSADPWANDDTAQIEDSRAVRAHVDVWGEEIAPANTIPALPKEAISASIWGEEINSEASTVKASPSTNTVSLPKGLSSLQEAEDRAPKNLEASKIVQERNAWGVDSNAVEEEQEVLQTISSAWADDNVDSNLAATTTSTTAQNDNWITLSVRSSNGSSFANAGADRRSPSGRGRGGGRGRGRGGSYTNYNNDDYRQRSGSSSFRPPVNEALRPRSTNQMYQAPDNCWQARTQSNLPNTSASSPRNVFLANNNNQSYISHASTSPAAQQSSFTHASQDVSYHLTNQGSMRSPQMMSDAQTPRQACIPTIVDMYGRSISLHHEGSNDNERLRETNNSTPSLTISDNNPGKSPWDD